MSDRAQPQQIAQRPQQIIKKRRKAARPHTQAQGRKFRIKKNPQGRKLKRSRERRKGSYTQGTRGRERGLHISHYKNDLWGTFQILF